MYKLYRKRMAGVTLIELIVAIVIVSAALAGLVGAFMQANRASANPVVTQQMLAIGESMMEEVLLKPFSDPDGAPPATARSQFNDVRDFDPADDARDGYATSGIKDIDGAAIAGLENYSIGVRVNVNGVVLPGVAQGDALRVTVTVANGAQQLALTGWRTRP
ncbi:prepilin-type N-terminal cleavage/methylation domain-containing protein [Massilia sp. H6]|uniref:prepilin-type N-terminal cleavage/methylation domain-containing protein n=1 Tax=Massilia sp. H6 TaxID=2970464 RepID=UPI002166D24A|nr:prepilin-type N-terminal cleavage/methylation domain-containing protein [Massilia sp. H6]UVW28587.1 type II secretion system GspH family protein [Massilia sp. H6]